jgi:hypothetical protein
MIKKLNLFLLFALLVSGSCTKTQTTTLQIKVTNPTNDPVSGASVTLYRNQTDMANGTNIYDVQYTDNNGLATFTLNISSELFFNAYRSSDCATNAFSKSRTGTLTAGQLNVVNTTLNQTGNVTFKNNSADTYNVKINGILWQPVQGGASASSVMIAGTYAIHVTQTSNVSGTPIEKDYSINVGACSTQTVNFP